MAKKDQKYGWQPYKYNRSDFHFLTKRDIEEAERQSKLRNPDEVTVSLRSDGERIGGLRMCWIFPVDSEPINAPIIVCDWCGEPIKNGYEGNYLWLQNDDDEATLGSEVYFTHKKCNRAFEHYSEVTTGHYIHWMSWELRKLPFYLGNNLNIEWSRAIPEPMMKGYETKNKVALRAALYERDGGICGICKNPLYDDDDMEIDHIHPQARGGNHVFTNLQLTHKSCNRHKSDTYDAKDPYDYDDELEDSAS